MTHTDLPDLPTGLYSYRLLDESSGELLTEWMMENNVPNPVPATELHCTVVSSTAEVVGYQPDLNSVRLSPARYRIEMMNRALVISFTNADLEKQYVTARSRGAVSEYPTFRPHITVSYQVPASFDLTEVKPPALPLTLTAEQCRAHDPNCAYRSTFDLGVNLSPVEVKVPPSLNVPRDQMPDLNHTEVFNFLGWIKEQGVDVTTGRALVSTLQCTAGDIDINRVVSLTATAPDRTLTRPFLISRDNYVLDFHHRWLALLNRKPNHRADVYRIGLPIADLLPLSRQYQTHFQSLTSTHEAPATKI